MLVVIPAYEKLVIFVGEYKKTKCKGADEFCRLVRTNFLYTVNSTISLKGRIGFHQL